MFLTNSIRMCSAVRHAALVYIISTCSYVKLNQVYTETSYTSLFYKQNSLYQTGQTNGTYAQIADTKQHIHVHVISHKNCSTLLLMQRHYNIKLLLVERPKYNITNIANNNNNNNNHNGCQPMQAQAYLYNFVVYF